MGVTPTDKTCLSNYLCNFPGSPDGFGFKVWFRIYVRRLSNSSAAFSFVGGMVDVPLKTNS